MGGRGRERGIRQAASRPLVASPESIPAGHSDSLWRTYRFPVSCVSSRGNEPLSALGWAPKKYRYSKRQSRKRQKPRSQWQQLGLRDQAPPQTCLPVTRTSASHSLSAQVRAGLPAACHGRTAYEHRESTVHGSGKIVTVFVN